MKSFFLLSCFLLLSNLGFSQNDWLKGTWTGEGYQDNTKSTWTIKLTVSEKYLIEYPSIPCSGEWIVTKSKRRKMEFRESIANHLDLCLNNSRVVIRKKGKDKLALTYYDLNSKKKAALAMLKKEPAQ